MQARRKHGLAAGAVVLAVFVAAPAIGAGASDPPVQPPPGTVTHTTNAARVPAQPAKGTVTHTVKAAPVPKQPVNRNPQKSTGFKAGAQLRHSKGDKGVKGLRPTKDHGKKNLPVQRER